MGGSVANVRRASLQGRRILADIWRRIRLVRGTPLFSRAGVGLVAVLALSCGGSAPSAPGPSTPAICTGASGVPCFGTHNYIEYVPGELPVVISVPHGGALSPASIPDRTVGTTVTDSNTIELVRAIST